ncbi:MAG: metallophosphoesterase [Polyangiales bacterium]|nr:metallophosphoesterase [Myxococcales bacterium]
MFRIAHVSDLHVLSPTGVEWRRVVLNKRITGQVNLMLSRGRVHRRDYLLRVLEAAGAAADHVVVTGDITNLAHESEYREATRLLTELSRSAEVTVAPGNHDVYLPTLHHHGRFHRHFAPFLKTDLPEIGVELQPGDFPCVKLRGPVAFIALSSAVPRPPFVSAGYLGHEQLVALRRVLSHPEVRSRTPVILVHHPPLDERPRPLQLLDGLVDAAALRDVLAEQARGLVLFGHTHLRQQGRLGTRAGALDVVSASGAALDHPSDTVRAGFNLYEIDDTGDVCTIEAHVLDPTTLELVGVPIAPLGA